MTSRSSPVSSPRSRGPKNGLRIELFCREYGPRPSQRARRVRPEAARSPVPIRGLSRRGVQECDVEGHRTGDLRLSGQVLTGAETGSVIALRLSARELAVTSMRDWPAGWCWRDREVG